MTTDKKFQSRLSNDNQQITFWVGETEAQELNAINEAMELLEEKKQYIESIRFFNSLKNLVTSEFSYKGELMQMTSYSLISHCVLTNSDQETLDEEIKNLYYDMREQEISPIITKSNLIKEISTLKNNRYFNK